MKTDNTTKAIILFSLILLISIALLTASSVTAKGIYKCIKPNGEIEYTQFPSENCKDQQIKKRGGSANQNAIDKLHEDKKRAQIAADERNEQRLEQQDQEGSEQEREDYCNSVRENLEQITNSPRVFETDAQGNRTRLGEDQRQQRIQDKKDRLEEHCS